MQRRIRRGLAVGLITMVLVAAVMASGTGRLFRYGTPSVAAADTGGVPEVGVQFHATWSDYSASDRLAVLDKLAAAHVQWVRIDLGWLNIEDNGPGSRNAWYLGMVDSIMDAAKARGINVLATL